MYIYLSIRLQLTSTLLSLPHRSAKQRLQNTGHFNTSKYFQGHEIYFKSPLIDIKIDFTKIFEALGERKDVCTKCKILTVFVDL